MANAISVIDLALAAVTCPRCGAEPGTPCRTTKRPRIHDSRVKATEQLIGAAVQYGLLERAPAGETKP